MYFFDWNTFWTYLWPVTALQNPLIRNGLIVTILVSIIAQAVGVILGLFAALGQDDQIQAPALDRGCLHLVFPRHSAAGANDAALFWTGGNPYL